jgi:FKBP-type peptidyl-prolyl cis-trans isomerase (trigger factor)
MKLKNIESLKEFLTEFEFDQIYCSEEFLKKIADEYNFKMNGEIFIDGFNDNKIGTILLEDKEIEIYLILDLDSIILKHSTIKNERRIKLSNIIHIR